MGPVGTGVTEPSSCSWVRNMGQSRSRVAEAEGEVLISES